MRSKFHIENFMTDITSILLLAGVGIAAGFINVTAGGGSTLTLPALIFFGLEASVANGTNRIAILAQNISAVYSFKTEKYQNFKLSLRLSLLTLPGAILGAVLAVKVSGEIFEKILALVMIGVIITMLLPNQKAKGGDEITKLSSVPLILSMLGIGLFSGFIQAGVGFLIMAALQNLLNMKLVNVNMHKVFIIFMNTVPALIIFIFTNNVAWIPGLILAAGNAAGAWWAAKLSVRKGDKFIKTVLIAAILIMASKLLNIF